MISPASDILPPPYPRAIDPMLRGIVRAKLLALKEGIIDEREYDQFARWLDTFLDNPINQYRPLPQAVRFHKSNKRVRICLGGNRCLGENQVIPSPDGARPVGEIRGSHRVYAWNGKNIVIADAGEPFVKGWDLCYCLHLSNGQTLDCSGQHLLLTSSNGYAPVQDLLLSFSFLPRPKQEPCLSVGSRTLLSIPVSFEAPYGIASIVSYDILGVNRIYDFHVPKFNNYLAGGVISHNSSKTTCNVQEALWYAMGIHPWKEIAVPNVGWLCTLTWEMVGSIFWEKIARLLTCMKPYYDYRVVWHNAQRRIPERLMIRVDGSRTGRQIQESEIIFKAYEQGADAFQGTERRWIGFDEQFPRSIWIESVSRIGAQSGLDMWASMTPIKSQPWLEEKIGSAPPNWDVFEFPLDDNRRSRGGFIADSEIDAAIEEWPEEVQATRRLGKFGAFAGAVYKTFSRSIHVVKESEEPKFLTRTSPVGPILPIDAKCIGAIDWGGANPTAFLWGCKLKHLDDSWYVFDEYYWDYRKKGVRLIREHASEILHRTRGRWQTNLTRVWADHDAQDRIELAAGGVPTNPAKKDDVQAGIEIVQKYMKVRGELIRPRLYIAARCVNLIRELGGYHYPDGTNTHNPKENPVDVDNHACDCLRYLLCSEENATPSDQPIPALSGAFKRTF